LKGESLSDQKSAEAEGTPVIRYFMYADNTATPAVETAPIRSVQDYTLFKQMPTGAEQVPLRYLKDMQATDSPVSTGPEEKREAGKVRDALSEEEEQMLYFRPEVRKVLSLGVRDRLGLDLADEVAALLKGF